METVTDNGIKIIKLTKEIIVSFSAIATASVVLEIRRFPSDERKF